MGGYSIVLSASSLSADLSLIKGWKRMHGASKLPSELWADILLYWVMLLFSKRKGAKTAHGNYTTLE